MRAFAEAAGLPAVRFRVTCVGVSLAAARATRSLLDRRPAGKPARATLWTRRTGLIGALARNLLGLGVGLDLADLGPGAGGGPGRHPHRVRGGRTEKNGSNAAIVERMRRSCGDTIRTKGWARGVRFSEWVRPDFDTAAMSCVECRGRRDGPRSGTKRASNEFNDRRHFAESMGWLQEGS
jgi:hypothetical protein